MRYWIIVVSKDHIVRGIAGGFIQANHGKQGPLKRLTTNDWVVCYSPKLHFDGNEPCQAFTAIGQVTGAEIFQYKMSDSFNPFRRNINYYTCKEVAIAPLIMQLEFIKNKNAWGYPFRFGFFEITNVDFELIKTQMLIN